MTILDYQKQLIFRDHDVKKTTLKKIKYKIMSIWDIQLEEDIYKDAYNKARIKECYDKGYPVLLKIHGVTRLLIFNRPLC